MYFVIVPLLHKYCACSIMYTLKTCRAGPCFSENSDYLKFLKTTSIYIEKLTLLNMLNASLLIFFLNPPPPPSPQVPVSGSYSISFGIGQSQDGAWWGWSLRDSEGGAANKAGRRCCSSGQLPCVSETAEKRIFCKKILIQIHLMCLNFILKFAAFAHCDCLHVMKCSCDISTVKFNHILSNDIFKH